MPGRDDDMLDQLSHAAGAGDLAAVEDALSQLHTSGVSWAGSDALVVAALHGHEAVLARLLAHRFDANAAHVPYGLALNLAARKLREAMVRQLLAAGADPHLQYNNEDAIDAAIQGGGPAILNLLLDAPTQPGTPPISTRFPAYLFRAACANDTAMAALLIQRGAHANNDPFAPALTTAAARGNPALMRLLLDAGASPDQVDFSGRSAFDEAIRCNGAEAVALLISAGAKVAAHQLDESFLMIARTPHVDAARRLLQLGASPNARLILEALHSDDAWKAGFTPLLVAAQAGHEGMVDVLMEAGADPLAVADSGRTLLMCVASTALAGWVDRLLAMGHDPLATDATGWTALMSAATSGHVGIVAQFIQHGCLVDAPDESGWTPLMIALAWGHAETADLLLAHGANPHAKDNEGFTSLMAAAEGENAALVSRMLATSPQLDCESDGLTALDMAEDRECADIVALLRAAGVPRGTAKAAQAEAQALLARQRQAAIDALARCLPGLTPQNWPELPIDSDALTWLYDGLRPQHLIDYFEWKEYWGEWPSVAPLASLAVKDSDSDRLLSIVEANPPDYPSQVPWFSYQNHLLEAHGLCVVTVAQENIYVMCVRDDPATLKPLGNCLAAMGLHLCTHPPLDLAACKLALQARKSFDN